jgi:hypothetical protein
MTLDAKAWALALLAAMALAACDKAVTGGNANAPGSPGSGNPTVTTAPAAADTPATGSGSTGTMGAAARNGSGLGGNSGLGMTGSFPAASAAR